MLKANKKEFRALLDISNDKSDAFYVKVVNQELTVFNREFSYSFELTNKSSSKNELSYLFSEFKNFIKDSKTKNDIFLCDGKMIEKTTDGILVNEINTVSYPSIVEESFEPVTTASLSDYGLVQLKIFDKFKTGLEMFPELSQTYITQLSDNSLSFMGTNGYTFVRYDLPINRRIINQSDKFLVNSQYLKNLGIIFDKIKECDIFFATLNENNGLFFIGEDKTVFIKIEETSTDFFSLISQEFTYFPINLSGIPQADFAKSISAYRKNNKDKNDRCMFLAQLSKNNCGILNTNITYPINPMEISDEYLRNSRVIINAYDLVSFLKLDGQKYIGINDECFSFKAGPVNFIVKKP